METSFHATFANDSDLEAGSGIELDYGTCGIITIRRAGGANKDFDRVLANKVKPYQRQIKNGFLDEDLARRLTIETYAETVVLGWKGVRDAEGQPLAFTTENAVRLFTDLPDLFREIEEQATRISNFRRDALESAAKN